MINCKRHIIAAGFILAFPLTGWSEAPVVDDSENFAMSNEQQAYEQPAASKYDDSRYESVHNEAYPAGSYDDGVALAKDDQATNFTNNARLIDKIQGLQQEVQELRGQLEVQAHDLKLLQQQQIAFYKDLDSRLSGDVSSSKPSEPLIGSKEPAPEQLSTSKTAALAPPVAPISRANPADEQISYLAAYELVKNKRYDEALNSMNLFVQKYPRGGYTANAYYWLGELYLLKKDYANAVEHFNLVLQQFPTSTKSAASMLKMGYAHAAMGNKPEAKKYLQQVVRAYPDTPTAQLANSKLKTI